MGGDRELAKASEREPVFDAPSASYEDFGSNVDRLDAMEVDDDGVAWLPALLSGCSADDEPTPTPAQVAPTPKTGLDSYSIIPPGEIGRPGQKGLSEKRWNELKDLGFDRATILPEGETRKNPGSMTQREFDDLVSDWGEMEKGVGLNISGSDADQRSFKQVLAEGLVGSGGLRDVYGKMFDVDMNSRNAAQEFALGANKLQVGRNQPDVLGDSARTGEVDLDDLEVLKSFPTGSEVDQYSREDFLAHVLAEQLTLRDQRMRNKPINGDDFLQAHQAAITSGTNATRAERGARVLTDQELHEDGTNAEAIFRNGNESVDRIPVVDSDFQR